MAAWMIPSAAAGGAFPVKSKQEAEAKCKEIGNKYDNYAIYRDGPQGNDILYACGYQSETKTKLNRSNKCDPKTFNKHEYLQNTSAHYDCTEDGKLQLVVCRVVNDYHIQNGIGFPSMSVKCDPVPGYQ
ncbi:predicted protein [Lichtheimia corymbifera JMRC:FSU:9682]|uniref:Uncharacterized protein n=1 Tax=Lichtheimia corymbifera JMRC:FSU:9682 TaxID=1263082 RepID=A0A068SDC2_9FUNG|nr:predicted protein [Lichtheimia corymbifera JMRC:FSU:9682]